MIAYLKARFEENVTWAAIGTSITGAALLPAPWSYLFVAVGVIGTLVPSPKRGK